MSKSKSKAVKKPTVWLTDGAGPKRKGDHKRKARPITPATVTVGPDSITVVVPDVLGKNASHKQPGNGRRGRVISQQTIAYRKSVDDGVFLRVNSPVFPPHASAKAHDGAWRLEVIGVWPTQNKQVGFIAPKGDADAAIPQALDALQNAGILDDDARVVEVRAWNLYRKGVRATVMRLARVPPSMIDPTTLAERDAAIAHLLPLVPQSTKTPATPKRTRKVKS